MSTEKADGYVAWHPGIGVLKNSCMDTEALAQAGLISRKSRGGEPKGECFFRLLNEGWRIRPVKLQFLDEPQGDALLAVKAFLENRLVDATGEFRAALEDLLNQDFFNSPAAPKGEG